MSTLALKRLGCLTLPHANIIHQVLTLPPTDNISQYYIHVIISPLRYFIMQPIMEMGDFYSNSLGISYPYDDEFS